MKHGLTINADRDALVCHCGLKIETNDFTPHVWMAHVAGVRSSAKWWIPRAATQTIVLPCGDEWSVPVPSYDDVMEFGGRMVPCDKHGIRVCFHADLNDDGLPSWERSQCDIEHMS